MHSAPGPSPCQGEPSFAYDAGVPRITDTRRAANRAAIIDAARRCFARDGFHQTSMPDLVAEAGISAGAFYRYFTGKDELIQEIARDAFAGLGQTVVGRLEQLETPSAADVVDVLTSPLITGSIGLDGRTIDVDEQARVALQAWAELARNTELQGEARRGLDSLATAIAGALARGQRAHRVPADLDPQDGARLLLSLLPGMILQRAATGHDVAAAVRSASDSPGRSTRSCVVAGNTAVTPTGYRAARSPAAGPSSPWGALSSRCSPYLSRRCRNTGTSPRNRARQWCRG
jgi:AcrR family transcriptional regulator